LPKVYTENIALHHKHKFLKQEKGRGGNIYGKEDKLSNHNKYDPPLPNSVIKETNHENAYNTEKRKKLIESSSLYGKEDKKVRYLNDDGTVNKDLNLTRYEPPLPNSVIKEDTGVYNECDHSSSKKLVRDTKKPKYSQKSKRGQYGENTQHTSYSEGVYNPPLPNSILEVKSEKGKHATQKPVALMEWILKYYSHEEGVVLDPTMGSGSMGVACLNKNRSFIGIEKDEAIYAVALERCVILSPN